MKKWFCVAILTGLMVAQTQAEGLPGWGDVEVTNLKEGMTVPRVFQVKGRTHANSRLKVSVVSGLFQTTYVERTEQEEQTKEAYADDKGNFELEFDGRRLLLPGFPQTLFVQAYDYNGHPGPVTTFQFNLEQP